MAVGDRDELVSFGANGTSTGISYYASPLYMAARPNHSDFIAYSGICDGCAQRVITTF
jgi:hypothetical protein